MIEVLLKQVNGFKFEASNSQGKSVILDGSKAIGGTEDGFRPMELILVGLAGCSSFDILSILKKQRQEVESLNVRVQGERANTIPSVYTYIKLIFEATGKVDPLKLEKACSLSMEKYCSVSAMLNKTAEIKFESRVLSSSTT